MNSTYLTGVEEPMVALGFWEGSFLCCFLPGQILGDCIQSIVSGQSWRVIAEVER